MEQRKWTRTPPECLVGFLPPVSALKAVFWSLCCLEKFGPTERKSGFQASEVGEENPGKNAARAGANKGKTSGEVTEEPASPGGHEPRAAGSELWMRADKEGTWSRGEMEEEGSTEPNNSPAEVLSGSGSPSPTSWS